MRHCAAGIRWLKWLFGCQPPLRPLPAACAAVASQNAQGGCHARAPLRLLFARAAVHCVQVMSQRICRLRCLEGNAWVALVCSAFAYLARWLHAHGNYGCDSMCSCNCAAGCGRPCCKFNGAVWNTGANLDKAISLAESLQEPAAASAAAGKDKLAHFATVEAWFHDLVRQHFHGHLKVSPCQSCRESKPG